jgi:hypothetical protein
MKPEKYLEHIQNYKGCDIMIYKYYETNKEGKPYTERRYCWGNLCWKDIREAKMEIDRMGRPRL